MRGGFCLSRKGCNDYKDHNYLIITTDSIKVVLQILIICIYLAFFSIFQNYLPGKLFLKFSKTIYIVLYDRI